MKWLILLFPLLVAALPQQRNTRSPLIHPRASATNSTTKAYVWRFNPDYDPDALVMESEVSGPYYSKENWNYRKVGNWLIEYAAIHLVADSDNFFEALYETPAFGRDNQEVCGLTPAGDNCIGGQLFGGTSTPFQLTNDEFNAQMVRQAIRNTFVYYRTLWSAIGDASREVSPLVGQMVLDLEKPVVVKPSGFFKVLDIIGGFIQFAGVFLPVEAIAVNIAETVVKDSVAAAKAGSTYFSISEEAAEKLAAATAKQLTTNYGKIKDSYAAGKALIGKLAAAQDDAESESPDDHMGDVLNYQAAADQFARKAMTFLESTWGDILNNGFSDGGIISQVFPGDILDLNVPATGSTLGASNDHGSGEYDNAVQQNFAYLMQRSMTQVLRDHGVRIVKRGSYATSDECMNAYNDEGYDWVDDQARACFADVDTPTQFSQYFPMVTGSEILEMKTYTGGKALLGSSWGDFTFNGQEFYQSATTCTNANGLWTDAQDQYSAEWGPQYSPPRMPDGTSQTVDANQLLCAFSAPVCDYTDGTFNEACRVYKNLMRDQVYSTAKQRGVDVDVRDGDMGPCSDRDLLYFCLVSLEQGPAGSTSFADVANAYVSKIDDWYIGFWGGLAGFEIWNEGPTLGSESLSAPIKRV